MNENTESSTAAEANLSQSGQITDITDKEMALGEAFGQAAAPGNAAGAEVLHSTEKVAEKTNAPDENPAGQDGSEGEKAGAEKEGKSADKKEGLDNAAWDKYVDGLKEDLGIDKQALKDFGHMAGELGLNDQAAAKIFEWGMNNAQEQLKARTSAGRTQLKEEWGAAFEKNTEMATSVVALLDRQLGDNRFKKAIENSGVCADPDFARGLYHIASLLSEDSLGINSQGGAIEKEESALEGLKTFFK